MTETGCALCGSTWGDYWKEIDGKSRVFCCHVCADSYSDLLHRIKEELGGSKFDNILVSGNPRARRATVKWEKEEATFSVSFKDEGGVRGLRRIHAPDKP